MAHTEPDTLPTTIPEIRAEVKRLKIDLATRAIYVLAGIALVPFDIALLCVYWNWFVVPLGLHKISFTLSFGLWVMWRFVLTSSYPRRIQLKKWPHDAKTVWMPTLQPFITRTLQCMTAALIHAHLK